MSAMLDVFRGLATGSTISWKRDDLRPGILVAISGSHRIFFESDVSRILVVRVLHEHMDYRRHLQLDDRQITN